MSDQLRADLAAVLHLASFTDNNAEEHSAISTTYSRQSLEMAQTGLGGTAQPAAFDLGNTRDSSSTRVVSWVKQLSETSAAAAPHYADGDADARARLGNNNYGTTGVINPI
ncbi:hypothetical protein ABT369_09205 [Dactylosporangium sp. NPDC000244]|uniref:hypothetical protein n=1 Tax=Dactylosporangium sp. NPDC000244 TaxID=3154365 RepID=UPI003317FC76